MFFSVIVPVYNVEKFLDKCIGSILEQSFSDFELILVDDGSPDNCPRICDAYEKKDCRVKVVHKTNGGLVSARKAGVAIATGQYVVPIDGDDFVSSNILQEFYNAIIEHDCDVVCCGNYKYRNEKDIVECRLDCYEPFYSNDDIKAKLFSQLITAEDGKRFPPSQWAKAYKVNAYREIQEKVPNNVKIGEDSCLTYPFIYRANSVCILQDCLYYYRQNAASMTKEKKTFSWDEILLRAEFYEKNMPDLIFQAQIARITVHSMFNVAVTEFYENKYRTAKRNIKQKTNSPEFLKYLKRARFKGNWIEKLAAFCLKHSLILPIYLYSKIK